MFSIQIASDLHIEINDDVNPLDYITPSADILILAGDIGSLYKFNQLFNFLNTLSTYFKYILYVPGNHEYYNINNEANIPFHILKRKICSLSEKIKNLIVLDQKSVVIDDICIAGCTLWSKALCNIPNFIVKIKEFNTRVYNDYHNNDLNYINNIVDYAKKNKYKLIIVTHYPPSYKALEHAKKRQKFISLYASHLDHFLRKDNIDTWICGHVHSNFDFISEGKCRLLSNQKGKPKDKINNYDKKFIIKL